MSSCRPRPPTRCRGRPDATTAWYCCTRCPPAPRVGSTWRPLTAADQDIPPLFLHMEQKLHVHLNNRIFCENYMVICKSLIVNGQDRVVYGVNSPLEYSMEWGVTESNYCPGHFIDYKSCQLSSFFVWMLHSNGLPYWGRGVGVTVRLRSNNRDGDKLSIVHI